MRDSARRVASREPRMRAPGAGEDIDVDEAKVLRQVLLGDGVLAVAGATDDSSIPGRGLAGPGEPRSSHGRA